MKTRRANADEKVGGFMSLFERQRAPVCSGLRGRGAPKNDHPSDRKLGRFAPKNGWRFTPPKLTDYPSERSWFFI